VQESFESTAGAAFTRSMAERAAEPLDPELYPYFEENCLGDGGALSLPALRHPLVYSVPHLPGMHWLANDQLRQKRASCREAIARRDWEAYVLLHERPYRPDALRLVVNVLAGQPLAPVDYWHLVTWTWRDSENIHQNRRQWRRLWLRSNYRASRPLFAMNPQERAALAEMPEELRVYRGQSARHLPGMSWTADRDLARWFAVRLRPEEPTVLSGRVRRDNVLAYLTGRNENELVLLPEHVELDVPVALTASAGD
jgi:hypothetical protein